MENKISPILTATDLRKTFTHPSRIEILKGVSLELYPGESLAIMGASGQGKSTLLHILGTLEGANSGELFISGEKVTKRNAPFLRGQHIGFVFQTFHLLDDYTTLQNVLMPALIAGQEITKGSPAYQRGLELLDQVGLSHRAHFSTKLLSGGEKQRAAIARALCNDPRLLLADEPSGNLDEQTSEKIHELLLNCSKQMGKGLIVVTHNAAFAHLCDRLLCLQDGSLTPL